LSAEEMLADEALVLSFRGTNSLAVTRRMVTLFADSSFSPSSAAAATDDDDDDDTVGPTGGAEVLLRLLLSPNWEYNLFLKAKYSAPSMMFASSVGRLL
jgi:hypothetical protein